MKCQKCGSKTRIACDCCGTFVSDIEHKKCPRGTQRYYCCLDCGYYWKKKPKGEGMNG